MSKDKEVGVMTAGIDNVLRDLYSTTKLSKEAKKEQDFFYGKAPYQKKSGTKQVDLYGSIIRINRWLALNKKVFSSHINVIDNPNYVEIDSLIENTSDYMEKTFAVAEKEASISDILLDPENERSIVHSSIKNMFGIGSFNGNTTSASNTFTVRAGKGGGLDILIDPSIFVDKSMVNIGVPNSSNIGFFNTMDNLRANNARNKDRLNAAIDVMNKQLEPVISSIESLFGVDLSNKRSFVKRIEKRVGLGYDFSTIFGKDTIADNGKSTLRRLSNDLVTAYSPHVDLLLTFEPNKSSQLSLQKYLLSDDNDGSVIPIEPSVGIYGVNICVTPILKMSKEFAEYISQSSPPKLSSGYVWSDIWKKSAFGNNGTAFGGGGGRNKPIEYVTTLSDIASKQNRLDNGLMVTDTRADASGIVVNANGKLQFFQSTENVDKNSVKLYEEKLERIIELSSKVTDPINFNRSTVDMIPLSKEEERMIDEIGTIKQELLAFRSIPLLVDWDTNIAISISPSDPSSLSGKSLNGASRPRKTTILEMLETPGSKAMSDFLHVTDTRGVALDDADYSRPSVIRNIEHRSAGLYAYMRMNGSVKDVSYYIREAAKQLGKADGISGSDFEHLFLITQYADKSIVDGLYFISFKDFLAAGSKFTADNFDTLSKEEFIASASIEQFSICNKLTILMKILASSVGKRRYIFEKAVFISFVDLWTDLVEAVGSIVVTTWLKSRATADPENYSHLSPEDVPFFYKHGKDPLFEIGNLNNLVYGLAHTLMLRDISADLSSPDSSVFSIKGGKIDKIRAELPTYSEITNGIMPFMSILSEYTANGDIYREIGLKERKNIIADPNSDLPSVAGSENLALLPHQVKAHQKLANAPEIAFLDISAGGGKCAHGNSLVPTPSGTFQLKELWAMADKTRESGGFRPLSGINVFSVEGLRDASMAYKTRGKTWEVVLTDGTRIEGLKEHKLWVYDPKTQTSDFKRLDELKPGDWTEKAFNLRSYPTTTPTFNFDLSMYKDKDVKQFNDAGSMLPTEMTEEIASILGYLVGGDHITDTEVQFSNTDQSVLDHFSTLVFGTFGSNLLTVQEGIDGSEGGYTLVFKGRIVKDFIRSLIYSGKSGDRNIPICVRKSPKRFQQAFLRTLYECAGSVHERRKKDGTVDWNVDYCSVSYDLAAQVRMLLENMGILTQLRSRKLDKVNGNSVDAPSNVYYVYVVNNYRFFSLFAEEIGFIGVDKISRLQDLLDYKDWMGHNSQSIHSTESGFYNKLPCGKAARELFNTVVEVSKNAYTVTKSGEKTHSVMSLGNHYGFNLNKTGSLNKEGSCSVFWVRRLRDMLNNCPASVAQELRTNVTLRDLWDQIRWVKSKQWVRVKSVVPTGNTHDVYDLSVPDTRNYAFNGIYGHNTYIGITDAINLMGKGLVKRPLIITPPGLISNWVDELAKIAHGKYNAIPIETNSVSRLMKKPEDGGIGEENFTNMLKNAPINTFFFTTMSFLRSRDSNDFIIIGGLTRHFFPNVEFLRLFEFDYILIDEVHKLKSEKALQRTAASIMTTDPRTKYLRFLSGTIVTDKVVDVVGQTSLADPTIFRNTKDFLEEFTIDNDAANLREGAHGIIRKRMEDRSAMVTAKRKEWSFMLPIPIETLHTVRLSETMQAIYQAILEKQLEDLKKNPAVLRVLNSGTKGTDTESSEAENLESYIEKYVLHRLDQFVHDPVGDELGSQILTDKGISEDDPEMVPPKVVKIKEIIKNHIDSGDSGKILMFARNIRSVMAIHKYLGEYKDQALPYHGSLKKNLLPWLNNPNYKILIATEMSLNTGYNLQIASRLIRVDTPWTPGDLDQAMSRIFRPDVSNKYNNPTINLDWIVCDGTAEVAKFGRLISKIMHKTRFDEANNPLYKKLDPPDPIDMSLKTLEAVNELEYIKVGYLDKYINVYSKIVHDEFMEKKRIAKEKGLDKLVSIPNTEMLPDSKIMPMVPFIEGQILPDPDNWGIVRVDAFLDDPENKEYSDDPSLLVGKFVITEVGKGTISRIRMTRTTPKKVSSVVVSIPGKKDLMGVNAKLAHIVTNLPEDKARLFTSDVQKPDTTKTKHKPQPKPEPVADKPPAFNFEWYTVSKNLRIKVDGKVFELLKGQKIAFHMVEGETTGLFKLEDGTKNTIPAKFYPWLMERTVKYKEEPKKVGPSPQKPSVPQVRPPSEVEVYLTVIGGNIALTYNSADADTKSIDRLHGRMSLLEKFISSKVQNLRQFDAMMSYLGENYIIPQENLMLLNTVRNRNFRSGTFKDNVLDVNSASELQKFIFNIHKKDSDRTTVKVWPYIENGRFHFAINVRTAPASVVRKLIGKRIPNTGANSMWSIQPSCYFSFVRSKQEAFNVIEDFSDEVIITNKEDLMDQIASINFKTRISNQTT